MLSKILFRGPYARFGLCFLLAGAGCSQRNSEHLNVQLNSRIEAFRASGFPVTAEEWNAWYPPVPANENAAPLYATAFEVIGNSPSDAPGFLEANGRALKLLHEAAERPRCRYPIDLSQGWQTPFPHLKSFKSSARLLELSATSQAKRGHANKAGQTLMDGVRLARSLEQEPTLIGFLVECQSLQTTLQALGNVLSQVSLDTAEINRLENELAGLELTASAIRGLAGEACQDLGMKTVLRQDAMSSTRAPVAGRKSSAPKNRGAEVPKTGPSGIPIGETDAEIEAHLATLLVTHQEYIRALGIPFPQSFERLEIWKSTHGARSKEAAPMIENLDRVVNRLAETLAAVRTAQVVLAIERYRAGRRGTLPENLKQLTPGTLSSVPVDPFDGQPLRFRPTGAHGYVVYSVGRDRSDDAGLAKDPKAQGSGHSDVVLAVAR